MSEKITTAIVAPIDVSIPANLDFAGFLEDIRTQRIFNGDGATVVAADKAKFTLFPDVSSILYREGLDEGFILEIAAETLALATLHRNRGQGRVQVNSPKPFKVVGENRDGLALRIEPWGWLLAAQTAVQGYYSSLLDMKPQSFTEVSYVFLGNVRKPEGVGKLKADLQHSIAHGIIRPTTVDMGAFLIG